MGMVRITGTATGIIEAGEAIGTTEGTGEDMREDVGMEGTKEVGKGPAPGEM